MKPSRMVRHAIETVAAEFQQPPHLIAALVCAESGFNPLAIGDGGNSHGLGQYNWFVRGWTAYQAVILFEPYTNLRYCVEYFVYCLEAAELCVDDALSAYNQGIAGWRERGKEINRPYWSNILALYAEYSNGREWGD